VKNVNFVKHGFAFFMPLHVFQVSLHFFLGLRPYNRFEGACTDFVPAHCAVHPSVQ